MWCTELLLNTVEHDENIQYFCFALQVGKTPKPEMKRILEEIDNIKTKVLKQYVVLYAIGKKQKWEIEIYSFLHCSGT